MVANVFVFCQKVLFSLGSFSSSIFEFLNKSFNSPILGGTYSLFDLLFGPGLYAVLGVMLIYWLIP